MHRANSESAHSGHLLSTSTIEPGVRWGVNVIEDEQRQPSLGAALAAAVAGICVTAGAVSLIDAAGGAQDSLTLIRQMRVKPILGCSGPWHVPGWGDGLVLLAMSAC